MTTEQCGERARNLPEEKRAQNQQHSKDHGLLLIISSVVNIAESASWY